MYNEQNNITPQSILKKIPDNLKKLFNLDYGDEYYEELEANLLDATELELFKNPKKFEKYMNKLTKDMQKAAQKMEFELAAELRDKMNTLKHQQLQFLSLLKD